MIIMNKEDFAKMPNGTVYCLWTPDFSNGDIKVKTGYYMNENGGFSFNGIIRLCSNLNWLDFYETDRVFGYFESNNFSVDESLNDYEDNQKFIVFDKFEIRRMIDVLTYALCNCEGICYTDFDCMGG